MATWTSTWPGAESVRAPPGPGRQSGTESRHTGTPLAGPFCLIPFLLPQHNRPPFPLQRSAALCFPPNLSATVTASTPTPVLTDPPPHPTPPLSPVTPSLCGILSLAAPPAALCCLIRHFIRAPHFFPLTAMPPTPPVLFHSPAACTPAVPFASRHGAPPCPHSFFASTVFYSLPDWHCYQPLLLPACLRERLQHRRALAPSACCKPCHSPPCFMLECALISNTKFMPILEV